MERHISQDYTSSEFDLLSSFIGIQVLDSLQEKLVGFVLLQIVIHVPESVRNKCIVLDEPSGLTHHRINTMALSIYHESSYILLDIVIPHQNIQEERGFQ